MILVSFSKVLILCIVLIVSICIIVVIQVSSSSILRLWGFVGISSRKSINTVMDKSGQTVKNTIVGIVDKFTPPSRSWWLTNHTWKYRNQLYFIQEFDFSVVFPGDKRIFWNFFWNRKEFLSDLTSLYRKKKIRSANSRTPAKSSSVVLTVFPRIVASATILFWIHKSLKISYSFLSKFFLM